MASALSDSARIILMGRYLLDTRFDAERSVGRSIKLPVLEEPAQQRAGLGSAPGDRQQHIGDVRQRSALDLFPFPASC